MTSKYVKILVLCNVVLIGVCVALLLKLSATTNRLNAVSVPSVSTSDVMTSDVAKPEEPLAANPEKPELSEATTQNNELASSSQNLTVLVERGGIQLTEQDISDMEFHLKDTPPVSAELPVEDIKHHQLIEELEQKQKQENQ